VVVLVISVARIAGAVVIMPSAASVNVGAVPVADSTTNSTLNLISDTQNYAVDLVISSCSGAAGTFSVTGPGNTATNATLKNNAANIINVTYTPSARGSRTCRVDVYDNMSVTPSRASFTITATGVAPVIGAPATVAFGTVRYNDAAIPHTATMPLTITNSSTDAGQVLTINNLTSSNSTAFAISGPTLPANINPNNGTATWTITFDPVAAGAASSTITIDSSDPVNPTKTVGVSGTGGTAVLNVTSSLDFGTVMAGTTSTASNIVVTNVGAGAKGALGVTSATLVNNTAGWFRFSNGTGCNGTTSCTLSLSLTSNTGTVPIVCQPPANASGMQMAAVTFSSDADSVMNGTTTVTCTAGRADVVLSPLSLAFADQLIGTTSTAQTVMISNTGNVTLMYSLSLAGTSPGQFSVMGASGCTSSCALAAMSSASISVTFRPTIAGAKSAILRVTAINDPDDPTVDVQLSGSGVAPISSPSVTTLTFGGVDVGDPSSGQMLMVTNTGTAPLTITGASIATGGTDYDVTSGITGTSLSIVLQPSQSASWTIACTPTVIGTRPGVFRIASNHNNAATNQDITLTCTGLRGVLAFVSPPANPYDFGGVREGDTASQTFTLKNTGNTSIANISVALSGAGTGYTATPTTIPSLAAGAQATVTATFAPLNGTFGGLATATYSGTWGNAKTTSADLGLNGDGLTTGYDATPPSLGFGDVRFDQSSTMAIQVVNTSGVAVQIQSLAIAPGTNTNSGEFSVMSISHGAAAVTLPFSLTALNDSLTVKLRCTPAAHVGAISSTLTVHSDLAVNPDRQITVTANVTSAMVAITPVTSIVDFGPVDIDGPGVTQSITLKNTGAVSLDLGAAVQAGSDIGRFTFSAAPAQVVAPGDSVDIDVTYRPTLERPAEQFDNGSLTFPLAGVFGGPNMATITLRGRGLDRRIAIAQAAVPSTFRNPGEHAPVITTSVSNLGSEPLRIAPVLDTPDSTWKLLNPGTITLSGFSTYNFDVRFSPIVAGLAPEAQLAILNADTGRPMAISVLQGFGVDRTVEMGPPLIDLGITNVGVPIRLSEIAAGNLLHVTSFDAASVHQIRDIVLDGDYVFSIVEPARMAELLPNSTRNFDVEFTPTTDGDFETTASLYLDSDPTVQATVKIRGHAQLVAEGGGCSTSDGARGGVIMTLAALLLARRRRSRQLLATSLVAVSVLAVSPRVARAQPVGAAAQAEALFREGRALMDAGKLGEACAAFDASQRFEPAISTLLNLANCREKNNELATAWGLFLEAERSTRAGVDESTKLLHQVALDRASRLEPRVSKLTISVSPESKLDGLDILRDKEYVDSATWNRALPINGGTYTITARAPGRNQWSTTITLENADDAKTVLVPKLTLAVPEVVALAPKPVDVSPAENPERHRSLLAVKLAGAGAVVAFGGAVGFHLWGNSKYAKAEREADWTKQDELWHSANVKRYTAEGFLVVGLASAGVATWLYVRASKTSTKEPSTRNVVVQPAVSRETATVSLTGSF
jgi:hypothetical protein